MSSEYIYENPTERGYVQVKLPRKLHNEVFPSRKLSFLVSLFSRNDYYYKEGAGFLIEHGHLKFLGKILVLLTFPVALVGHGVYNFEEIWDDRKRVLFSKKYGCFSSDMIWNEETIQKLLCNS